MFLNVSYMKIKCTLKLNEGKSCDENVLFKFAIRIHTTPLEVCC